jgi:hypothetical protein
MVYLEELMLQRLVAAKWEIVRTEGARATLPDILVARYPKLPSDYGRFLSSIETCVHPAENSWFLGLQDFEGRSDSAFSWDDLEKQSLEAAEGDEAWQEEIRSYWSEVLPIALSVRSGYAYLGLRLGADELGAIVHGREPEFEETVTVAASFHDLCQAIIEHLDGHVQEELIEFL